MVLVSNLKTKENKVVKVVEEEPSLYVQDSEAENTDQSNLGSLWHAKLPDDESREDDDDQIGCNVVSRIAVPELGEIDTGAVNRLFVSILDRNALKDRRKDARHRECEHDACHAPAEIFEPADDLEDAEVEEQDRYLGEADVDLVEDLGVVEEF